MDKILNINGVEYIRKSEYDKAKKDVETIKQLVSSSIADLSGFLNNPVTQQLGTSKTTTHKSECFSLRNKDLKIRVGSQKPYHIERMDKDGYFYSRPNRKLIFNVKDVIAIQKVYDSKTDKNKIKQISKQYGLPIDTIHRIIYNIDINSFNVYIKEYLSSANNIKIKKKDVEYENNPQKRKESGMFV